MILASVLLIVAFSISTFSQMCYRCDNEVYTLVLTGVAYSIYGASFWASIPYIVSPQTVGTAFGIVNSFQNFGVFAATLIAGYVTDHTKDKDAGYFWPQAIFILYSVLSLIVHILLLI